ncbi:MAG TPA: ABC transporter permease [Terriglobales bacterium]|nr:ABC transporter permease [Terriglobales bacterium]
MRVTNLADTLTRDAAYTFRVLRKDPAFALTAIITLALGIGANTAIFTVVRAVLLRPLQYRDPDRVVELSRGATPIRFELLQKTARSYIGIGAYANLGSSDDVALTGDFPPEVIKQSRVSANFLSILGVEPLMGRSFTPEEDLPNSPPVVIISNNLWQRRFGGDPQIVGKTINVAGLPHTVVGVMPSDFKFPFAEADVWFPQPKKDVTQFSPLLRVFGRLAPGISLDQANAELQVIDKQYSAIHPGMLDFKAGQPTRVEPLKDQLVANVRSILWILFGAVSFVLLISCSNVAGLLLARATSRSREFAVRAALGATRSRLGAQLLIESILLALAAGVVGILFARWMLAGLRHLALLDLPRLNEIHPDIAVLAFALLVSLATGLIFGLLPSISASRPDLVAVLKARGEATSGGRFGRFNVRSTLVAGQVALCIVLLSGATLLVRSLVRLNQVDPGFNRSGVLAFRVSLSPAHYDDTRKISAFYEDLLHRIEGLPGVRSAGTTLTLPMMGYPLSPTQSADEPLRALNDRPLAMVQFVSPDYFRTLQIPLVAGREFNERDRQGAPEAVVINEAFARKLWSDYPHTNPIGKRIIIGAQATQYEVVGIVGDTRQSLDGEIIPGTFRSSLQLVSPTMMVAVRTQGDPWSYVESIRKQVLAIDAGQPISNIHTMDELAEQGEGQRHLVLLMLGVFAAAAVLLTMIGIHGTIAYWVLQRTRELGIRRALGAPTGEILWIVIGRGLVLTLAGLAMGIIGAIALTRLIRSWLFQVSPTDPLTFGLVALLTVALSLLATYIPARRAARVDPMAALRME